MTTSITREDPRRVALGALQLQGRGLYWIVGCGACLLAVALWAWLALQTVGPIVLADEYWYWLNGEALSDPSRLVVQQFGAIQTGNALFLRIIHALARRELPVDLGIKAVNLASLTLGYGLLTWSFRGVGARALPLLVCAVFLPAGSYAAYVMPECLYFALFSILMVTVRHETVRGGQLLAWSVAGLIAALLTLAKSHGVFIYAGFVAAAALWIVLRPPQERRLDLLGLALSAVFYAVALKLGNALLAPALQGPVGSVYIDLAHRLTWTPAEIVDAFSRMLIYGFAVGMVFAPALGALVLQLSRAVTMRTTLNKRHLASLLLLSTGVIVAVVVALVIRDQPDRVHLRYVNFAFPWLLLLAVEAGPRDAASEGPLWRPLVGGAWLLCTLAFLSQSHWFHALPVDSPLLFAMYRSAEFGAFGLGGYGNVYVGVIFVVAALALILSRTSWMTLQAAALACVIPLALWNVSHWQAAASQDAAGKRSLGREASALCGSPRHIEAIATPEGGVTPFYPALAQVGLGARLKVFGLAAIRDEMATAEAGDCVLTPATTVPPQYRFIDAYSGINLYRR